ncbi:hypothetical protein ANCCAN_06050 [Ancylostoma caninum]|uniref:Uncharacterized protein n=1 Tax=Ancylostoma caninum TaxID=29170 RepID=A0A368GU00_ANCCA|nr:hypothetical protein ANCCAN_06050 [Ancylostoma caninum]
MIANEDEFLSRETKKQPNCRRWRTTIAAAVPAYLEPLVARLRMEESIVGYEGEREYHSGSGDPPVNREEEPVILKEGKPHHYAASNPTNQAAFATREMRGKSTRTCYKRWEKSTSSCVNIILINKKWLGEVI